MILCIILPVCAANSAQMCAANTTTTIVLDPTVGGLSYTYDAPTYTWQTSFSYGTVNGVAACLSSAYGKTYAQSYAGLTDNGATVVGGELNGQHCWCRMTHPAVSLWVFSHSNSSTSDCASYCTNYCGNYVRYNSDFRAGLFGSVAN